jgi:hypothetical protein
MQRNRQRCFVSARTFHYDQLGIKRGQVVGTSDDTFRMILKLEVSFGDRVIEIQVSFGDVDSNECFHGIPFLANTGSLCYNVPSDCSGFGLNR